jgi:hypothetical protein
MILKRNNKERLKKKQNIGSTINQNNKMCFSKLKKLVYLCTLN